MSDREADSEVRVFSVHLGSLHSELALRSIANVDKSGKIEMETPSYFEKYSRQTFYAAAEVVKGFDGRSYTEMKPSAVGPFPQCLRVFQRSVKGVFFGNLRAKATIEHEKQKTSFRLAIEIQDPPSNPATIFGDVISDDDRIPSSPDPIPVREPTVPHTPSTSKTPLKPYNKEIIASPPKLRKRTRCMLIPAAIPICIPIIEVAEDEPSSVTVRSRRARKDWNAEKDPYLDNIIIEYVLDPIFEIVVRGLRPHPICLPLHNETVRPNICLRVRHANYFDINTVHPSIQVARSVKTVLQYVTKDNEYVKSGCYERYTESTPKKRRRFEQLSEAKSTAEVLDIFMKVSPRQLYINRARIVENTEAVFKEPPAPYQHPEGS
ncbi:hypothetical protein SeLEV6574_g08220 [Synchytrium endobioticum]|uniref:Uncharacterized protein n=1 Tax=Synchytrium endobioticum TaxID=286115 RepID=A0A507CAF5_9FUNG|nr:hypothetical protein SeLEV6574_g08220 [Synchytrium endobioticum]